MKTLHKIQTHYQDWDASMLLGVQFSTPTGVKHATVVINREDDIAERLRCLAQIIEDTE